jgi:D-alanyl-D-alanine carboxypeptidase (penicillin-binding protein 5/6)
MSFNVLKSAAPMPCSRIKGNRGHRFGHLFNLKALFGYVLAIGLLPLLPGQAYAMQQDVPVVSYIVKETGSPNVLMAKDVDRPVSPASLTKVMTCVMAIESGRLDDTVVVPKEATLVEPTKAGLRPGDRIQLRDLVRAAMVNSSNDAAFAIAIHLGGSVDLFVSSMNARAKSLGMNSSHFTNPAGFDSGIWAGNRTTARDLMALTEHAVRNPEFNAIARLDRATFRELSTGRVFSLKTHNKLLDLYPYTVGIKTGFTNRAGKCLIARAIKERKDLLMVMLNARTDRWTMASNMFDQGFVAGGNDRMAMPALSRPDSEYEYNNARQVAFEREKALEALRLKVARQTEAGAANAVTAGDGVRQDTMVGFASKRSGQRVMKSEPRTGNKGKALRTARKSPKATRTALTMRRKGQADAKLALRTKKSAGSGAAASRKTRKRTRGENRSALNHGRKGGEVTKVAKPKHRKEALSSSVPSAEYSSTV